MIQRSSLIDSDPPLVSQTQNRELVSQARELEERLQKEEQVNHGLKQEKERLEKQNHDFQIQAIRLTADTGSLQNRCEEKEAQLQSLAHENESLLHSKSELTARQELLQQRTQELESEMEKLRTESVDQGIRIDDLTSEIDVLKAQIVEKDNLITALKDMLKELDAVTSRSDETDWAEDEASESKVEELMKMAQSRVQQDSLLRQNHELEQRLSEILQQKEELTKELNGNMQFVDASQRQVKEALDAKDEAEKRLQVLEKYFNSREVELQRELGALQVRRQQKEEDASSLERRLFELEEERDSYKSQLESMRRELSESERSYKTQLAKMEKSAYENWVAARNSEREASDLRRDAVYLRQELTMLAGSSNHHSSGPAPIMDFSSFPLPPPPPPPPATQFPEQFLFPPMPPYPPHECMTPDSTGVWDNHNHQPPSPREAV